LLTPVFVSGGHRSDALDVDWSGLGPLTPDRYRLEDGAEVNRFAARGDLLADELDAREAAGGRLLRNFLTGAFSDAPDTWRCLYRLPPRTIDWLKNTQVGPEHLDLLRALPKADLHRHLGGCLDLEAQQRVAWVVWNALSEREKEAAMKRVAGLLGQREWPWASRSRTRAGDWTQILHEGSRPANVAALLSHADQQVLEHNLYDVTEPRVALRQSARGFPAFERPGELTGSAILGHEAAIAPYAHEVYQQALREGLRYVEVRGSATKYLHGGYDGGRRFLRAFARAIAREQGRRGGCEVRFVLVANRKDKQVDKVVRLALDARSETNGFVVGVDLAGDESLADPSHFVSDFAEAFRECLPVTVHAGEGTSGDSVWKAAYDLHADRIGHGLGILSRAKLARRLADRNICLELCPTSNLQVIGFRHPRNPRLRRHGRYPLRGILRLGIPVTLCTDNPGICRTELAQEFVMARRLARLTLWEALTMMWNGFAHAFVARSKRIEIRNEAEDVLFGLLSTLTVPQPR
jgi:adenosine deaminase